MEVGKWIALAFLAGAVLVGFRTRTLKWYEFVVSGLFVLLLDGLVFGGQISDWIGQLGANVKETAGHAAAGAVLLGGPRARRFARRVWEHRPAPLDYLAVAAATVLAHCWLGLPVLAAGAVCTAVLAGMALLATLSDRPGDGQDSHTEQDQRDGEAVTDGD